MDADQNYRLHRLRHDERIAHNLAVMSVRGRRRPLRGRRG